MPSILDSIYYILLFFTIYFQVFFLVTFLENRRKIVIRRGETRLLKYGEVTVLVPCWNEERTLFKTVKSILNLRYPQDKIKIFLIDDGSTDGTWGIMQKFKKHQNVRIFRKENGGKHTALNLGLAQVETEYVACLDADSIVHPEALSRLMSYFEKDKQVMAVTPSIIIGEPKNIVQYAQRAEYNMAIYTKKMLSFLGAIFATPGPFTIFRKKVFDDLGPYRHGHNSEDMELACRMQENHYKIEKCNDAYVSTSAPVSIRKLFRQRVRWQYGFINNTIDYKKILFDKKYGNFSWFSLPAGIFSMFAVSFLFGKLLYKIGDFVHEFAIRLKTVGFNFTGGINLDPFFINTKPSSILLLLLPVLVFFSMVLGRKIAQGKWGLSLDMILCFFIFSIFGPFWVVSALFSTVASRKPSWR